MLQIARMDMDTTQSKNALEKIIQNLENQKTDILIGTQMVTKGLDFEHVSVVGILNADNLINFPDFRAHERAFQLILQVSGRAGRKHNRGKVIIQTSQPEHPINRYYSKTRLSDSALHNSTWKNENFLNIHRFTD